MNPINIVVVSAGFLPAESQGGVPYSTYHLCKALSENESLRIRIISSDRNGDTRVQAPRDEWTTYNGLSIVYCSAYCGSYSYCPSMRRHLQEAIGWADVVISSSTLWDYSGLLTEYFCRQGGKANIVYPRGLLDEWALNHKRSKKIFGLFLQGRRILRNATTIVALSLAEEKSIRKLNSQNSVVVIPNGAPPRPVFEETDLAIPEDFDFIDHPYVLFLGRVCEKKGLANTLTAFRSVIQQIPNARIVIAGAIDSAFHAKFLELCSGLTRRNLVTVGPVAGVRKHILLANASGFILTSASEGVPMAALEAMQYSLPLIVTPECNIVDVAEYQAGWIVPFQDIGVITLAQLELFSDEGERVRRGVNAFRLANERYSWKEIGHATADLIRRSVARRAA